MHVPEDHHYLHLGFSWLSLLFLIFPVIGFVIRRKWRLAVARKEEIKRLLILASEEAARAELEATAGYYGAVSSSLQFQCAVCYCPTTTRCARCKSVRYCSGKCQIIHWRQGHKEECYPSSTTQKIIDEGSNSSQKAVKQAQHGTYGNSFETEGRQCVKPIETFHGETVLSDFSSSTEVPCGKDDDDIKVEFLADAKRTNSTSNSSSTSFSDGFSTSTNTSESSDDVSVSESIGSNDLDKIDEHQSADIAPDAVETASTVNNVNRKPLSAEFNSFGDAVYSSTSSCKLNQIKSGCSDGEIQYRSTSSSGLSNNGSSDCSVAEPSKASHGFWEGTLDSSWSRNDARDDPAQSNSSGAGDGALFDSESFLRFSFNLSGNTTPPLQSQGSKANPIVSDDAQPASLGINKPIDEATLSKKVNIDTSKFEKSPSANSERSNHMDNDTTADSHILRSKNISSRSLSASAAHPSCTAGGELTSTNASKVTGMPSLSSTKSNHAVNGTSSDSHLLKSREVESLSSSFDAQSYSRNGGHSISSMKTGKVDGVHAIAAISSHLASYSPNASNGLKTSVRKVVDQFKSSRLSKHCSVGVGSEIAGRYSDKGLFSYEQFVKLYIWNKVELRPCGLTNCGNSCYANVVLQCLAFTPPLTAYLLQGLHSKACVNKEWCFTCEFQSLILKAKEGSSPLSPIGILSQIQNIGSHLGNGREEDAHEFLRYAIDTMQSVCLKEANINASGSLEEETTLIGLTFGGYLRSKIRCMKCQGKSECHERMMDLTVEIEGDIRTLDEALRQFTRTEILDGENMYQCNRCKSYEKAKKKLTVLEAPNVLTIALKRFQSGKFGKLNKPIEFPEILDLAPYMSGTSDKSPIYRLYGVVVHLDIMNAAFSGHYVCYVKNNQNKWFKIDDSSVKAVEIGRVLKKGAYMLLYTRCLPRAPRSIRNSLSRDPKIKSAISKLRSPSTIPNVVLPHPRSVPSDGPVDSRPLMETIFEADSSSDTFSLFSSCSDEGSCSTESTRDSTSTDDLSDCIFGDPGHSWKSHWRNSSDSDTSSSSSSPLYLRHEQEQRYACGSQEASGLRPDYADSGDSLWARLTGGVSIPEDLGGKGSIQILHSDSTKHYRKLDSNSSSFRETDSQRLGRVNPFDNDNVKIGVSSRKSTRERTG